MIEIKDFLAVADAYQDALSVSDKTLSYRVFGDSKKLSAIRGGADITVGRFNAAILWFADNWPDDEAWPEAVVRPNLVTETVAAQ